MDVFRTKQNKRCGPGGLKCYCCNCYRGKDKAKLNRMVRRNIKQQDKNKR